MALDCDCRNRCAKRRHRDSILGKRGQETFDKVRIALLYVVHEVMHLARRGASGVFERYRDLGPPSVSQIFGEDTASNHHQRQRPDRTKQATQQKGAPLEIELAERVRQDGGYRRELPSGDLRIRGVAGSTEEIVELGIAARPAPPSRRCAKSLESAVLISVLAKIVATCLRSGALTQCPSPSSAPRTCVDRPKAPRL